MRNLVSIGNILLCFYLQFLQINCQRTELDNKFISTLREVKRSYHRNLGRTGQSKSNFKILSARTYYKGHQRLNWEVDLAPFPSYDHDMSACGNTQQRFDESAEFFCDTKNGPGRRSDTPPNSVHRLRPGDIDIIGAIGDSLTAGNGILSTRLDHILNENRGVSYPIGGQGDWRQFLTIPNILKEFNPNLYGYPVSDSWGFERASKFNVAEGGAISGDIPYEAKILVKRLQSDPKVNMTAHWKLVTIFIGANDFCLFFDLKTKPKTFLDKHKKDLVMTLRYLRDNVPRLFIILIPGPDIQILKRTKNLPDYCSLTLPFLCPNFFGANKDKLLAYFTRFFADWQQIDKDIANSDEFNTDTFAVSYQLIKFELPRNSKTGNTDLSYLASDCFHLSQKSHAFITNTLWNNLLESESNRDPNLITNFEKVKCPTDQRPYLSTKLNDQF